LERLFVFDWAVEDSKDGNYFYSNKNS